MVLPEFIILAIILLDLMSTILPKLPHSIRLLSGANLNFVRVGGGGGVSLAISRAEGASSLSP